MNREEDNSLDRRIILMLDGELDGDEQAAVQREILRDDSARELYEAYLELDRSAQSALSAVLSSPPRRRVAVPVFATPAAGGSMRWHARSALARAVAVAAVVAMAVGVWSFVGDGGRASSPAVADHTGSARHAAPATASPKPADSSASEQLAMALPQPSQEYGGTVDDSASAQADNGLDDWTIQRRLQRAYDESSDDPWASDSRRDGAADQDTNNNEP